MGKTKNQHIDNQEENLSNQETGLSLELSGLIKLNKSEIKERSNEIKQRVLDGELNPLDVLIMAKKGIESFKQLETDIRPIAEEESYGKGYVKHGVSVEEKMNGVKYDFSNCGDKEWEEINAEFEAIKLRKEKRETFLKTLTKPLELVDTDTGETYTIHPPIKSGKIGLTLTIK